MAKAFGPREVLTLLKIEFFEKSSRLAFCCPFHNDKDPSAGFYHDTELAHCFSCQYTLDPVMFYAKYNDIRTKEEAVHNLEKRLGPIELRVPLHDKAKHKKTQIDAEKALLAVRDKTERKVHAHKAETLDRILLAYERDQINDETLDKAMAVWYNRLTEGDNHAPINPHRAAEAGSDGRIEEGSGDLPRAGYESDEYDLD